jgi:hypothetical protein
MIKRFGILNSLIALIGVLALGYLIYQVWYGMTASRGTGVVESFEKKRRGQGAALVTYEVEGKPVEATLRVWLLDLEKGEQVAILYRPEKPDTVQMDDFRQRYAAPIGLVLFAFAVVGWEFVKWRRQGGPAKSGGGISSA